MNYFGSYRKLHGNSRAAMLSAVEIYNKPQISYRDEIFVILLLNAWELLFKAILSKARKNIFYPKRRGEPYRTLSWHDAMRKVVREGRWPPSIPRAAVEQNLLLLANYRDHAVHFYNANGFGVVIFGLAQTSITNYRDVARAAFGDDLADAITWQLMPLGVEPPIEPMQYLRAARERSSSAAVSEFLGTLTDAAGALEQRGGDTSRLMTIYDVKLQSIKKLESADLVVGVDPAGDADDPVYVERRVDPTRSHPLLPAAVVAEVGELHGRAFSQFDLTALSRKFGWGDKGHLCWHDEETGRVRWSRDVVAAIRRVPQSDYADARKAYGAFRERQKKRSRTVEAR